jgi:hypothetical protein
MLPVLSRNRLPSKSTEGSALPSGAKASDDTPRADGYILQNNPFAGPIDNETAEAK